MHSLSRWMAVPALALTVTLTLSACQAVSRPTPDTPDIPTVGVVNEETIAHACRQRTVRHQGTAGFEMMADGKEAYLARLALVEAAQHTLDFQYFIWADDVVGTHMADRLLAAADRGVKVRMLLDVTMGAQAEVRTAVLAAHPNIEIAFFNPMLDLKGIFAGNPLPVIGDLDRMQRRMHNKMIVADETLMIGGGRNLGDTYFGVDPDRNMRDLDFIAQGPVVAAAGKSFDLYWQSPLTRHGDREKLTDKDREKLQDLRRKIAHKKRRLSDRNGNPFPVSLSRAEALRHLQKLTARMIWAEYEFVADPPERQLKQEKEASPVWSSLEKVMRSARHELVMHAAYLIPQDDTLSLFRQLTDRGTQVKLLTNSLASIDGLPAMTGIAHRRADILNTGAELHELNAKAPARKDYIRAPKLTPMGMHTKGLVVDDRVSFIGSYNMDPRSKYINTETGVIIRSPAFAARLKAYLGEDLKPENCWRITTLENGRICWTRQLPDQPLIIHHRDPDVPWSRRLKYWMLTHMPWEDVL